MPPGQEGADFDLHILLEPAEQEAEAERFVERIWTHLPEESRTEEKRQQALQRLREDIYQHRIGRFRVECSVMDGNKVLGIGAVQIEIVFKGRFSDLGFFGAPPA